MKNYLYLLLILLGFNLTNAQVGIGTTTPNNSSILDIESTDSGVLFPRLTTSERNIIANPATGLLIYNSDDNFFQYNIGTPAIPNWVNIQNRQSQSGSYNVGSVATGWEYYTVTFSSSFSSIPAILLTFREGTGIDNSGSHTSNNIKVANASTTGFTIGIYSTAATNDIYIDWFATLKTQ